MIYMLAIEPAWRTRTRLAADLPRLRTEVAELDALGAEAKKLKLRTRALESAEKTKATLARLLAEKSLSAEPIRDAEGERLVVTVKRADAGSWLAWLKDASSELPLRVSAVRMSRVAPGLVDAEATLMPAGQK